MLDKAVVYIHGKGGTAVIYLVYKDGELRMCDYHIFRDTFKD